MNVCLVSGGIAMGINILIVDDEEKVRKYLARLLLKRGFIVSTVCDGNEALQFLQTQDVDIVLLDVLMPGPSGLDTLPKIKGLRPLTEVLMLTGNASVECGVEGIRRGAFDYLLKPADLNTLLERIQRAMDRRLVRKKGIQALDIPEMRTSEDREPPVSGDERNQ
jgi:DNA-binding NtrC family response regulator